jgi:hypothetical protein
MTPQLVVQPGEPPVRRKARPAPVALLEAPPPRALLARNASPVPPRTRTSAPRPGGGPSIAPPALVYATEPEITLDPEPVTAPNATTAPPAPQRDAAADEWFSGSPAASNASDIEVISGPGKLQLLLAVGGVALVVIAGAVVLV